MTLAVLMSVGDKCLSICFHTLAQLFSPSSSVSRNDRIPLSLIDSRSRDAKDLDQYGELLQTLRLSKNCNIALDLKVVVHPDIFITVKRITTKNGHLKPRDLELLNFNDLTNNPTRFI